MKEDEQLLLRTESARGNRVVSLEADREESGVVITDGLSVQGTEGRSSSFNHL